MSSRDLYIWVRADSIYLFVRRGTVVFWLSNRLTIEWYWVQRAAVAVWYLEASCFLDIAKVLS